FHDGDVRRVAELAERERRSMTQEAIHLLSEVVSERLEADRRSEAQRQADAWQKLAGRWESDKSVDEDVSQIYRRRTSGREVDL
ncbi:MAG: hypothetical protein ABEL76_08950, partial [Bradymonadaceae bacterium]